MSRCEHGQMISIYCVNESCNWREAGGCEHCFKRYHSHPSNIGTITQDKLDDYYRKMIVRPDPKVKSRILQQAVYNYFIIMKSQISSSLQAVSRAITSKLNYPYLAESGQLETFNKIKNKEYKKLNKKQLKSFCQFAGENSKQMLEQKEKQIYSQEIIVLGNQIQKINDAFVLYAEAVKSFDNNFDIEKAFVQKINQIVSSIDVLMKSGKTSQRGSQDNSRSKGKRLDRLDEVKMDGERNKLQIPTGRQRDRDRRVSFDATNDSSNKFDFRTHENQMNQRKKRLMEMDNVQKKNDMDEIKVGLQTGNNLQAKNIQPPKQVKNTLIDRSAQKYMPRQFSADKQTLRQERPRATSRFGQQNDLDPRSEIVHTTLPRQASRPKLYEHSKDVKEKKFTIPVKIVEQNTQCPSSPILKKKKTLNLNKGLQLFKVQSRHEQQNDTNSPVKQSKPLNVVVEQKTDTQDNVTFKQKETDSLALLISAISLSAEQAIPRLQAAIKYAHNNLSAAEYLSFLYLEIGKPKQCLTICNQFLQQIENSPQANELGEHLNNNKAAALNLLGRYSESINILEKCIQATQKDIYYKNLGDAYFSIGIHEKAVINYQKAIRMNPDMDQALYNLAVCLYTQGHFLQAQFNVQRALKLNIKNESYNELSKQISNRVTI